MRYNNPKMPTINVVFGKAKAPAKFWYRGKRISVDTAFEMYKKKSRFVVGGKTLNVNRFGAITTTMPVDPTKKGRVEDTVDELMAIFQGEIAAVRPGTSSFAFPPESIIKSVEEDYLKNWWRDEVTTASILASMKKLKVPAKWQKKIYIDAIKYSITRVDENYDVRMDITRENLTALVNEFDNQSAQLRLDNVLRQIKGMRVDKSDPHGAVRQAIKREMEDALTGGFTDAEYGPWEKEWEEAGERWRAENPLLFNDSEDRVLDHFYDIMKRDYFDYYIDEFLSRHNSRQARLDGVNQTAIRSKVGDDPMTVIQSFL